ncbi:MAG: T9SS type A sorting domain-containing protein [Bacteroidales bacterium]|nr:T9SS type A sorting domain-containing protein [Bacteroidales bacterium]
MKTICIFLFVLVSLGVLAQQPIIIDHNCIRLSDIPIEYINAAKTNLNIGYGHTSHGSQLISGMDAINAFYTNGTYNWSHDGGSGKLHLFEGSGYDEGDLDHDCGYTGWDTETSDYLDTHTDCNVIIWSWCGQVNEVDVLNHYLLPMNQLEQDYPNVTFIYMTGHLEGLGPDGSLFQANQQIRNYCITNNKILFDFADIEKYSPDCDTNFQNYFVNDGCEYNHPLGGTANWANDWLARNQGSELAQISQQCNSCEHSVSLNCVKKGIAAWYLWAAIAGWEPIIADINKYDLNTGLQVFPNPVKNNLTITFPEKVENIMITIIDSKGNTVYKKLYQSSGKLIILSEIDIPKGAYILKAQSNNMVYNSKFIK